MRTLLIESTPNAAGEVAGTLDAAGHEVVRCHHEDGPSFPCAGLTGEGCPIEAHGPVDVAIAVRGEAGGEPTVRESGATCALRIGIPLVVVGTAEDQPYDGWAETVASVDEVPEAVDRAIVAAGEKRAAPLVVEAKRLLEAEGVEAGEVTVEVTRDGTTAHLTIRTEREVSEAVANALATRVHAVDAKGSWHTTKVSVAVARLA